MATRGTIYIVPNREKQQWDLVVQNAGSVPFGVTNNILLEENLGQESHDDTDFGHGLVVNPGRVSHQAFPRGATYDHDGALPAHDIDEDCFIRVGLRGCSFTEVKLPPMDGKPIAIDIETQMNWYGQSRDMDRHEVEDMADFVRDAKHEMHHDVADGDTILAQIAKLMGKKASLGRKVKPKGHVIIKAVAGKNGRVKHWDLRFTNTGDNGFMGTAVFEGTKKNAGRGLESMAVPDKGSSAEQRIVAGEDYGIQAEAGAKIRLGVRGHSTKTIALPRRGKKRISIADFERTDGTVQPEFFNKKALREKRREKIGRVKFFQNGKKVKLRPAVFTGDEARARAEFDPPRLGVRTTGGGWLISLQGRCPFDDDRGDVGFVPTFLVNGKPVDAFEPTAIYGDEPATWRIPKKALRDGDVLTIDTGALGWSTEVKIPGRRAAPKTDFGEWSFREHRAHRYELEQELRNFEETHG